MDNYDPWLCPICKVKQYTLHSRRKDPEKKMVLSVYAHEDDTACMDEIPLDRYKEVSSRALRAAFRYEQN